MERVSIEVWERILLNVMETNNWPIFATSCTPYTFLTFMALHIDGWQKKPRHLDYLAQRRSIRLVCRAWNEFVLFTSHRWLLLEVRSQIKALDLDSTTTSRAKGGVGPIERLSTAIHSKEFVAPVLAWASHILKRSASQSPLRIYILQLYSTPVQGYNPFDDLLVGTTSTHDPECKNTNTTLRTLSIAAMPGIDISISLAQISCTFTGLRSLFLYDVKATPQQTLTLAHLEVLFVYSSRLELETLQQSMEKWDTPALRHVYLGDLSTPLTGVLDRFLGRYAHQIESLILSKFDTYPPSLLDLPSGFWAQFTALRLLGLDYWTLKREEWSGWSIVPPPTHPCRYLVCRAIDPIYQTVRDIRSRWTWHDGVRFVAAHIDTGPYHGYKGAASYTLVKNIQDLSYDGQGIGTGGAVKTLYGSPLDF